MIINHKYKFIFLKTRKTAGTSIEIALSKFCDDGDVITRISKEDEQMRRKQGFPGPRNYGVPLRHYSALDWMRMAGKAKRKRFFNHADAEFVRGSLPDAIWDNYFKFTIERDPFDKAISRYYWSTKEPRPDLTEYLDAAPVKLLSNWNIYTINDRIAVDFVVRYESLDDDLAYVSERLGLPEPLALPRAKSAHRKSREHYSHLLSPAARQRIEIACAKEMTAFGYRWQEPPAQQ